MTSIVDNGAAAGGPGSDPVFPPQPFVFRGRGSEYFRIWIVNLLLTLVTLGIYSAWAKVRRNRYLYDNTSVAGSSFDYHGNPIAILKGRVITVLFLVLYHFGPRISFWFGVLVVLAGTIAVPWMIWKSLQFKLRNSSYRGIRFGFHGSLDSAYYVYLLFPMLTVMTLYILAPFTHQRMKRYQHNGSRFGDRDFSFHARPGSFYKIYLGCAGLFVAGILATGFLLIVVAFLGRSAPNAGGHPARYGFVMFWAIYALFLSLYPIFIALLQNTVWNNTRLGQHRFSSTMRWPRAAWIVLGNVFLIIVTLGLFVPFATIRWQRYRIESMTLLPASDLTEFVAGIQPEGSVTGEGVTDLFDIGLSL